MAEERTVSIPYVDHELDEIRSRLIALGEWYGRRDSYSPGADLPSLVSIVLPGLVDAASSYLRTKEFPEGIEGMEMTHQMADRFKSQLSELESLVRQLEGYRSNWSTFSEADRFGISLTRHFDTRDGLEAEAMLDRFDSQLSETILRSAEIRPLLKNAYQTFRKYRNRPTDHPFHRFTNELFHIGVSIALHDPGYSKSDQVSGPWIDYLLSAIKPLRPETTPSAVASEIERWKRLRKEILKREQFMA